MKPSKQAMEKSSSGGVIRMVAVMCVVLVICGGFLIDLGLLMRRIAESEELVKSLNETCHRQRQYERHNNRTSHRTRRDTPHVTLEVVRSEVQSQLSRVTSSQICEVQDKLCIEGLLGPKGEPGSTGRKGEKGKRQPETNIRKTTRTVKAPPPVKQQ